MLPRSRPHIDLDTLVDAICSADLSHEGHTQAFEDAFARYLGAYRCIAMHQARSGLYLSLKALKVQKGDEVIVQSFTYRGVMNAIMEAGATPVLVDSSIRDLLASPEAIGDAITDRTKAIVATHLFGIPADIEEIVAIARERGIPVLEDCAQCLGARCGGRMIGTFGDAAFVSFNFEKHMSTGEGGMLILNNRGLAPAIEAVAAGYERVPLLREKHHVYGLILLYLATRSDLYRTRLTAYFGQDLMRADRRLFALVDGMLQGGTTGAELEEAILGYLRRNRVIEKAIRRSRPPFSTIDALRNLLASDRLRIDDGYLRMNALRALVGSLNLQHLDHVNRIRNENAQVYADELDGGSASYVLPIVGGRRSAAFLKYNVLNTAGVPLPQITARALKEGLELGNFQWHCPVHRVPLLGRRIPHDREKLRNSEYISANIINLPVHPSVGEEDISRVVQFLKSVPRSAG